MKGLWITSILENALRKVKITFAQLSYCAKKGACILTYQERLYLAPRRNCVWLKPLSD